MEPIDALLEVLRNRKEPIAINDLREGLLQCNLEEQFVDAIIGGFHARSPEELREHLPKWIEFCVMTIIGYGRIAMVMHGSAIATYDPDTKKFNIKEKGTVN